MDQVIWIEILSRQRDVTARFRCAGPELHIGRGYDNDVVIDDPCVAPRHVRVFRDESGRLMAANAGSRNGIFLEGDRKRYDIVPALGASPIRIGRTIVRIREASHAVPAERPLGRERRILPIVLVAALVLAITGIEILSAWSQDTFEPKLAQYLAPLAMVNIPILGWVGVWSVLARIFSGHARCQQNLLIALSGLLAFSLYNELATF